MASEGSAQKQLILMFLGPWWGRASCQRTMERCLSQEARTQYPEGNGPKVFFFLVHALMTISIQWCSLHLLNEYYAVRGLIQSNSGSILWLGQSPGNPISLSRPDSAPEDQVFEGDALHLTTHCLGPFLYVLSVLPWVTVPPLTRILNQKVSISNFKRQKNYFSYTFVSSSR